MEHPDTERVERLRLALSDLIDAVFDPDGRLFKPTEEEVMRAKAALYSTDPEARG